MRDGSTASFRIDEFVKGTRSTILGVVVNVLGPYRVFDEYTLSPSALPTDVLPHIHVDSRDLGHLRIGYDTLQAHLLAYRVGSLTRISHPKDALLVSVLLLSACAGENVEKNKHQFSLSRTHL